MHAWHAALLKLNHAASFLIMQLVLGLNGRRPKGDDSGKRSFPYEARSAESKKRDKG